MPEGFPPQLDRTIEVVDVGECTLTQMVEGQFVRTAWAVPRIKEGTRFQLSEPVLRAMALAIGFVPLSTAEEAVNTLEAKVEELEAQIAANAEELSNTRWAAERYWASEAAKSNERKKGILETRLERANGRIHDLEEQLKEARETVKEAA